MTIDIPRKEILINCFDILKNDIENYWYDLSDIIVKMLPIDEDTGISMWVYLLKNNSNFVKKDTGTIFCNRIVSDVRKPIGEQKLVDIIIRNEVIENAIFKYCELTSYGSSEIIAACIVRNDLKNANSFLEFCLESIYLHQNQDSIADILINVIGKINRALRYPSFQKNKIQVKQLSIYNSESKDLESFLPDVVDFITKWSVKVADTADLEMIQQSIGGLKDYLK